MSKLRLIAYLTLLIGLPLSAQANKLDQVKSAKRLVAGIYKEDVAPFFMANTNKVFRGFDIELARQISEELGVHLVLDRSATSFDDVIKKVETGKVDIGISKLSRTLYRGQNVRFSKPYLKLKKVLLVNRLSYQKLGLKGQLDGLNSAEVRYGVIKGSSYVLFGEKHFPKSQSLLFDDRQELIKAVISGRIDFTYADESVVQNWLFENQKASILVRAVPTTLNDDIAIAIGRDHEFLHQWIDLFIDTQTSSGQLEKLSNKYLRTQNWRQL